MNKVEVFSCYSVPLMQFLTKEKGIEYLLVALNQYNSKKFWAFVQNDELSKALTEWTRGSNKAVIRQKP